MSKIEEITIVTDSREFVKWNKDNKIVVPPRFEEEAYIVMKKLHGDNFKLVDVSYQTEGMIETAEGLMIYFGDHLNTAIIYTFEYDGENNE